MSEQLKRELKSPDGIIVCECRGMASEVLQCLNSASTVHGNRHDTERGEIIVDGALKPIQVDREMAEATTSLASKTRSCALAGLKKITEVNGHEPIVS